MTVTNKLVSIRKSQKEKNKNKRRNFENLSVFVEIRRKEGHKQVMKHKIETNKQRRKKSKTDF